MRYSKEESKMIWDQNAEFWDYTMGDESMIFTETWSVQRSQNF